MLRYLRACLSSVIHPSRARTSLLRCFLCTTLPAGIAVAQGVFPVGADRVIALGSDPGPVDPAVAVDGARRSVNAWWIQDYSSGSDELAQAWSCNWTGQPLAGVIQVNTDTSTSAQVPAVGARDDGGFVVVWQQVGDGVLGQRFSSPDTRVGDEFGVESSTTGGADPRIAMNAGGAFVVVWEANGVDGSGTSIHARRFAADTTP